MTTFSGAEGIWAARLGGLRNVVRQHVITTQIDEHLHGVATVLDVGCGQGTQALRLARRGFEVTGVDPSADLLAALVEEASGLGASVRALHADLDALDVLLGTETFDLVCAHGLLMYLPDAETALGRLAARVRPGGRLSFTVRNGDALAYRPGIRGDFATALAAFDDQHYRSDLGIGARAHTQEEVRGWCDRAGLLVRAWYGVRVLTDGVSASVRPGDVDLASCLAAEVEAGTRDPYRHFGSMLHFVAVRL